MYPAFYLANIYSSYAGLTGTDYENGWYVPSIAELCEVYKNNEAIQTSLTKASGFSIVPDTNYTDYYWSSSPEASDSHLAYIVDLYDGKMYGGIGIYDSELKEWLWRWDCGTESNTEQEKGQASDCFKRAGFKWGIGVELYTAPFIWASVKTEKDEERKLA